MPVLSTSNFDDDSIKNKRASTETAFPNYKCVGNVLDAQAQFYTNGKIFVYLKQLICVGAKLKQVNPLKWKSQNK